MDDVLAMLRGDGLTLNLSNKDELDVAKLAAAIRASELKVVKIDFEGSTGVDDRAAAAIADIITHTPSLNLLVINHTCLTHVGLAVIGNAARRVHTPLSIRHLCSDARPPCPICASCTWARWSRRLLAFESGINSASPPVVARFLRRDGDNAIATRVLQFLISS